MLDFIGCGSAFNTALGNNSAYREFGDTLFMIDCGSANFDRIRRAHLLDGVKQIDVLITHLHADHVGSLGDLILYAYYSMQPMFMRKVRVLVPEQIDANLRMILQLQGVTYDKYNVTTIDELGGVNTGYMSAIPVHVTHVAELDCYGYTLSIDNTTAYYSGDANMIPDEIIGYLNKGYIDYFYQDTCGADYPGNVHLSLKRLQTLIPDKWRNRVYCMHLDEQFDTNAARELQFNVVEPVLI